jgi:DNA repair exonuclease SbcCD ATPase subunit
MQHNVSGLPAIHESAENTILQSTAKETEENPMSENLEKATPAIAEVSTRRQYAEKLHNDIIYNADMVSSYLVELCKNLKRMRDEQLYKELGFDTFDDYVEKDVNIKKRQAYTYISSYEKLGDSFLQSNAHLGITRLSMLTEVPAADRPGFADDNDLANMSTREIKEMIEKLKDTGEQLSLITGERDSAQSAADNSKKLATEFADEINFVKRAKEDAEARADALAAENEKLKKAEPDAAVLEKYKKDAEKAAKKDFVDKLKVEKDKLEEAKKIATEEAQSDINKKLEQARNDGEKAAESRIKSSLESVEQEKAAAIARASELEKQLKVSGNQDTVMFKFLFDAWQQDFLKMCGLIKKVDESDNDFANKLRDVVKSVSDQQRNSKTLSIN